MKQPKQFLIDGIDRLGKSTLIQGIQEELGYHLVIHYDKPKLLKYYTDKTLLKNSALRLYQYDTNMQMFNMIQSGIKTIFDRTHLGEMVYAPLYREYNGDYIYQFEEDFDTSNARLILLTTSNLDLCVDDGQSFNFENKDKEQDLFVKAFDRSTIKDKVLIDVYNGKGAFKSKNEILTEALKCTLQSNVSL